MFSAQTVDMDLSALDNIAENLDPSGLVEITKVWNDSLSHRLKTTFTQHSGWGIINSYGILRTQHAPELVCHFYKI